MPTGENPDGGLSLAGRLLHAIGALGLEYGREDAFKMVPGRLIADRLLVGVQARTASAADLLQVAELLGMPGAARDVLLPRWQQANAVFFGTEESEGLCVGKMYLEFWDQVRRDVLAGARDPQLLHFGVKWTQARPGQFEQARYLCHPLLSARDVLRRMALAYSGNVPKTLEPARAIIRHGYRRAPDAAFLYVEVSEQGNPRCSFDINLYKGGLRVAHAATELRAAAASFGIEPAAIETQLQRLAACPLGHLSGGLDRHGQEFLSVYAEIQPLPG